MINIIAAIQEPARGLGMSGQLLYAYSDDLKRFKALTLGHPILMGRKTFESIGRPLPHRANIVVTRNTNYACEGVTISHSLEDALAYAKKLDDEIFIIGGGELYKEGLPRADRLYLTVIHGNKEADVFFPEYSSFTTMSKETHKDEKTGDEYTYIVAIR